MPWTDSAENTVIDWELRGQTPTLPSQWYVGLFTVIPTDSTAGTEITTSGTNYARVPIDASLTAWSGTQGAGTTSASSGTSGESSNNASVFFATPSTNWGTAVAFGLFTASTGGTLWRYGALDVSKSLMAGDPVYFPAGSLKIRVA